MTSGQMLLAGFNGLFTKVAGELTDMFTSFEQVHFDKFELQFDIVKDAQDLQVGFLLMCITQDKRIPMNCDDSNVTNWCSALEDFDTSIKFTAPLIIYNCSRHHWRIELFCKWY